MLKTEETGENCETEKGETRKTYETGENIEKQINNESNNE
jgi:hypothetical protein